MEAHGPLGYCYTYWNSDLTGKAENYTVIVYDAGSDWNVLNLTALRKKMYREIYSVLVYSFIISSK